MALAVILVETSAPSAGMGHAIETNESGAAPDSDV